MKQLLIFTFYTSNDYNSKSIKISLFIFSFALSYTINALFFDDTLMHKIYEDQGSFNFIYQIPILLYSSMISSFINIIIHYLSLSQNDILEIKYEKKNKAYRSIKILKCLNIKFILFYILSLLFLIFFWYYLSCFCAVYKNTQLYLIKDTLISYGLSLLYPFLINLLPGIFRISSLKAIKRDKHFIYKISRILQLI